MDGKRYQGAGTMRAFAFYFSEIVFKSNGGLSAPRHGWPKMRGFVVFYVPMISASTQTGLLFLFFSISTAILNVCRTASLCHAAKKRGDFNRWRLVSSYPVAKCTARWAWAILSLFHGLAVVSYSSSSQSSTPCFKHSHTIQSCVLYGFLNQSNGVNLREFKDRLAEGFNLTKHSRSGKARWVIATLHSASDFILRQLGKKAHRLSVKTFIYGKTRNFAAGTAIVRNKGVQTVV